MSKKGSFRNDLHLDSAFLLREPCRSTSEFTKSITSKFQVCSSCSSHEPMAFTNNLSLLPVKLFVSEYSPGQQVFKHIADFQRLVVVHTLQCKVLPCLLNVRAFVVRFVCFLKSPYGGKRKLEKKIIILQCHKHHKYRVSLKGSVLCSILPVLALLYL